MPAGSRDLDRVLLRHPALHHLSHAQLLAGLLLLDRQPVLHLDPVRRRCDEQLGRTRLRGKCCRWRRRRTGQPLRCMRSSHGRHPSVMRYRIEARSKGRGTARDTSVIDRGCRARAVADVSPGGDNYVSASRATGRGRRQSWVAWSDPLCAIAPFRRLSPGAVQTSVAGASNGKGVHVTTSHAFSRVLWNEYCPSIQKPADVQELLSLP